ncbi:cell division protein [Algimonas arctica]|uniref:Cell division protein n=1 Tax=Algimonas arctica TaxID=1479486 RepID=A0A8J3CS92_9PROT|nr:FtsX-like permease family protein [Algimonas arctica]GHA98409.1 cell division protein [Algimonas arctica]
MIEPLATQQPLLPSRPEQGRALLVVLTVMAFLAALALMFANGADRLSDRWTAQLTQSSTVQLLISSEAQRETQTIATRDILRAAIPEARLTLLSREQSAALIQPWLGDGTLPPDLPIPGVIRIDSEIKLPIETLERQFSEASLKTVIDDHSRFSGQLKQTVGRLVLLGIGLVALIGLAATAVSMFATRAGLAAQRDIIHVLVQAGATDGFIAWLFVGQAARRGLVGAALGAGFAVFVWIFISVGPGQGSVGWRGIMDGFTDGVALILLCTAFAVICAIAAGWSSLRQLRDERRRA